MKAKFLALLAVIVFAGGALFSAETAGIGVTFGIGVGVYDDSRFSSVTSIVELDFQLDKNVSLVFLNEKAAVAFDSEFFDLDYIGSLTGFGLMVDVNKYVTVGVVLGKADSDTVTARFADIAMEVNLLSGSGEKIGYNLSLGIKRRMIDFDDIGVPGGDIENSNLSQFALKAGIIF